MGHDHSKEGGFESTPLGYGDIFAGLVIFIVLYFLVAWVAGPDGYSFLKGRLSPDNAIGLLASGCLLLFLWTVVSPLVIEPYLAAFYEREARTKGRTEDNHVLRRELSALKNEFKSEVSNAKIEGVRRKNAKVAEAKREASDVYAQGRQVVDSKWSAYDAELNQVRDNLLNEVEKSVADLAGQVAEKVVEVGPSASLH